MPKLQTSEAFEVWKEKAAEGMSFHVHVEANDPQLAFDW